MGSGSRLSGPARQTANINLVDQENSPVAGPATDLSDGAHCLYDRAAIGTATGSVTTEAPKSPFVPETQKI